MGQSVNRPIFMEELLNDVNIEQFKGILHVMFHAIETSRVPFVFSRMNLKELIRQSVHEHIFHVEGDI